MISYSRSSYNFFKSISETVESNSLILPADHIICALSGGLDSVMLFNFLLFYREEIDFRLSACHLHHNIRPLTADEDEEFVRNLCSQEKIELDVRKVDVPALAQERKLSLEAAGRVARHEFFRDLITKYSPGTEGSCRIALAHHADDAVETFLLNLGRGSGSRGVSTMRISDDYIIRPLLEMREEQLREIALAENIAWREDETNLSDEFLRNRIRHHLLPLWTDLLNYDVTPVLLRYINSAREDEDYLSDLAENAAKSALLPDGSLSTVFLADQEPAIQKRILRIYLEKHYRNELSTDQAEISSAHLSALSSSINNAVHGDKKQRLHYLPQSVVAEVSESRVLLLNNEQL
ncbi:MAG: tRNA lysidine(34) synthetase TilS [Eubacteriales bacterium]|nr:tRNA lysidine(34) synthetase TilS [Eubacteriales bacterium]MDD4541293.1 tRNA lysidine(34) synthetase TilS [Eubacteriales bacterium]